MKEHIESEPIDKWVKDLKTLSTNCEFKDENDQLRDKIVFSYKDNKVKERMLRDQNLDLAKTLEICRAAESTKVQIKSMCNSRESEVNIQELRHSRENSQERNNHRERNDTEDQFRCYNCTGFGHLSRDCPNGDSYPRGRSSSRRGRRNNRSNSRGGRGRSASWLWHHLGHHHGRVQDVFRWPQMELWRFLVDKIFVFFIFVHSNSHKVVEFCRWVNRCLLTEARYRWFNTKYVHR